MVHEIDCRQLKAKLDAGESICLVDVRQPWEHEMSALPNSVLIPLNELPSRKDEVEPPAGALVVVYCHHGIRSRSAAALLEHFGIANVVSLAGGIEAWSLQVDARMPRY